MLSSRFFVSSLAFMIHAYAEINSTRQLMWSNWQHKEVQDEPLFKGGPVSALAPPPESERLSVREKTISDGEEGTMANYLYAESIDPVASQWGRWLEKSMQWLPLEAKAAKNEVAFGILTTVATAPARLGLLKHWWFVGAAGCIISNGELSKQVLSALRLPPNLGVCEVPGQYQNANWYRGHRDQAREALAHLVIYRHFPARKWYVVGDDDTLFSPLALAQYLENFDSGDEWYIGGRSDSLDQRKTMGWDMAVGAGGIVLSRGLLDGIGTVLERCFEKAQWGSQASRGDWILHRCLSRIGIPLTPCAGLHGMHEKDHAQLRDTLERHPTAPLLSVHSASHLFTRKTGLFGPLGGNGAAGVESLSFFFYALWHDPVGFAQLSIAEVKGERKVWTAVVSAGISVSLWPGALEPLLWHSQTRTEAVAGPLKDTPEGIASPPPPAQQRGDHGVHVDPRTVARYVLSPAQRGAFNDRSVSNFVTLSTYEPVSSVSATRLPAGVAGGGGRKMRSRRRLSSKRRQRGRHGERSRTARRNISKSTNGLARWVELLGKGWQSSGWENESLISQDARTNLSLGIKRENNDVLKSLYKEQQRHQQQQNQRLLKIDKPAPGRGIGTLGGRKVKGDQHQRHQTPPSPLAQPKPPLPLPPHKISMANAPVAMSNRAEAAESSPSPPRPPSPRRDNLFSIEERSSPAVQLQKGLPYALVLVVEVRRAQRWLGGNRKLCHASTHEIAYMEPSATTKLQKRRLVATAANESVGNYEGGVDTAASATEEGGLDGAPTFEGQSSGDRKLRKPKGCLVLMLGFKDCAEFLGKPAPLAFPTKEAMGRTIAGAMGFKPNGEVMHRVLFAPGVAFIKPLQQDTGQSQQQQQQQSPQQKTGKGKSRSRIRRQLRYQNLMKLDEHIGQQGELRRPIIHRTKITRNASFITPKKQEQPVLETTNNTDTWLKRYQQEQASEQRLKKIEGLERRALKVAEPLKTEDSRCRYVAWKKEEECDPPWPDNKAGGALVKGIWDKGTSDRGAVTILGGKFKAREYLAAQQSDPMGAYLGSENETIGASVAFGIISSAATLGSRLDLLKLWWLPGAVGCLSLEGNKQPNMHGRLPNGMEVCSTPQSIQSKPWYREDMHGTHRGAVISLVVFQRFPRHKWYVVGDDDTLFSPLALAQYLENYNAADPWYIGGHSEDVIQRRRIGWDMAFGGGGIVLSGGLLKDYAATFERCLDQVPWNTAPGGDWVLHRCLVHLGIPLTPSPGMHQLDVNQKEFGSEQRLLDILERHPVSPFLSIHHPDRVFGTPTSLVQPGPFFEAMHHDPTAFLQLVLCEVPGNPQAAQVNYGFTAAVSAGLSVRLWKATSAGGNRAGPSDAAAALLWDQTRTEVLSPPVEDVGLYATATVDVRYVFSHARESGGGVMRSLQGLATVSVYELASLGRGTNFHASGEGPKLPFGNGAPMANPPIITHTGKSGAATAPYAFVVVVEERQRNRWIGAPLKFCHAGSFELGFQVGPPVSGSTGVVLMLAIRDCHIPPSHPVRVPSRDEIKSLIQLVLGFRSRSSEGGSQISVSSQELPRAPQRPYLI